MSHPSTLNFIDISSIRPIILPRARSPEQPCQEVTSSPPPLTLQTHPIRDGLRLDDFLLTSGISDSVHYPPSIHSHVLRGSSCRAVTVEPPANYQNPQPLSSNDVLSPTSKAWCHVYSNRNAYSSQRTQCAAVAH